MKYFFIVFLFLLSHLASANPVRDSIEQKYFVGLSYAPGFSYRTFKVADDFVDVNKGFYQGFRQKEIPSFNNVFGLGFGRELSKNISVKSGVNFFQRGYHYETTGWHDTTGIFLMGEAIVKYEIESIGMPVGVEFEKSFGKVFLNVGLTWFTEYILSNKINADVDYYFEPDAKKDITTFDRTDLPQKWGYKYFEKENDRINFSAQINAGFGYVTSKNTSVCLSPYFNYNLKSIFKYPIKEHLMIGGLLLDARIKF